MSRLLGVAGGSCHVVFSYNRIHLRHLGYMVAILDLPPPSTGDRSGECLRFSKVALATSVTWEVWPRSGFLTPDGCGPRIGKRPGWCHTAAPDLLRPNPRPTSTLHGNFLLRGAPSGPCRLRLGRRSWRRTPSSYLRVPYRNYLLIPAQAHLAPVYATVR